MDVPMTQVARIDGPQLDEDLDDELDDPIEIYPADLYWSEGFDDGDLFWDVREWLVGHEGLLVDTTELLEAVIEEHVIDRLDPVPTIETIHTCHNPVRAVDEDGDWDDEEDAPDTWPEVVEVPLAAVLELARSLAIEASAADIDDWRARREDPQD